ncbi:hypothetical protein ASG96_16075 [Terrabacter sp. Soil810]|nr:hypothetical protein ASD90_01710 [Terrabacter sp. Root181]KRF38892.1 hypothetical protein ASG96_16075 [Terrabacter sp. Soil810]
MATQRTASGGRQPRNVRTAAGRDAIVSVLDHVAIPTAWEVTAPARRVEMTQSGRHLSDHDAYVVDVEPGA